MDFNKLFHSRAFRVIVLGIGALLVLSLVFGAGVVVGFKKASFSYKWGENYHRNFGGPRGGFFSDFSGRNFIDSHGVFGQIIKIDAQAGSGQASAIVIKGSDNVEKIVSANERTVVTRFRDSLKLSDLKINDFIVVIGDPNNNGQIEAKFIRVLPGMMMLLR